MKISSMRLDSDRDGLCPFKKIDLGEVVILSGSNGSGKTRLLKLIQQHIKSLKEKNNDTDFELCVSKLTDTDNSRVLNIDNVNEIEIINYSHYDASLQFPNDFTPYVISKAKDVLKECNYQETALNSLLLLEDMANVYSEEFKDKSLFEDITKTLKELSNIDIEVDGVSNHLKICGLKPEESFLSPGQQYLLRIAIACRFNATNDNMIIVLDEPELHLHPKALIKVINLLKERFPDSQLWISTHSLSLISYLVSTHKNATVLCMENGQLSLLRSNSTKLLDGLIGEKENRFRISQLLALPDEYACNRFSFECQYSANTISAIENDPEADLIRPLFKNGDVVVDFGVGKGRLLEELSAFDIASNITYYAYDNMDKDATICKKIMNDCGVSSEHYFNNKDDLIEKAKNAANYVLLVNVLHEIEPKLWMEIFNDIKKLLCDNGKLIIVEREELTVGESPYDNGFLMMTHNASKVLFGENNVEFETHLKKPYIVKYTIAKKGLDVTQERVKKCVEVIKQDSLQKIKEIKQTDSSNDAERFRNGIRLAFYLEQFATATIINENN